MPQSLMVTLDARRRALELDDGRFAARIGISRSQWSLLRAGRRRPGRQTIAGIMAAFPDLTPECMAVLQGRSLFLGDAVTDSHTTMQTGVTEQVA